MTTTRRRFVFPLLVVLAAAGVALASAPAASASCVVAPPLDQAIAQADVVFVGTVDATDHDGLTATFRVDEVWKGNVGETAVVHGGPGIAALEEAAQKGQGVATSVDRTYTQGKRYLVLPYGKAGGVFLDNVCSSTQLFTDELVSFRPTTATPPLAKGGASGVSNELGDTDGLGPWTLLGVLLGAAVLTAAFAGWGLRARRARAS
jgi:hypothetical protein